MDIQSLKYFLTVAEEGNITSAAVKLHMSQPPLSRQIAKLEDEVGTPLLVRTPHGVNLTDAGKLLKSRAADLISARDKMLDELHGYRNGGYENITLGIIDSISMSLLPDALSECIKRNENVNFTLLTEESDRICELIDGNIIDMGIVRMNIDERVYGSMPFHRDTWVAVMSEASPLGGGEFNEMSASMLRGQPLILPVRYAKMPSLSQLLDELDLSARAIILYSSLSIGLLLAEKNVGICLAPSSMLPHVRKYHGVIVKGIKNPTMYTTAHLIWKKNNVLSPAMSSFLDFIKDYLKDYPAYAYGLYDV